MGDAPDVEAWDPWTPADVAARLASVTTPWCIVAGWAIELFLGKPHRDHEDLEIAVLADGFDEVRAALEGFRFFLPSPERMEELPAGPRPATEIHQNWVLDPNANVWRLDVMLEPGDASTWVFRRDERITAPREFMIARTTSGIAYLRPHGVLLFKAKLLRPKDEADFRACLPLLSTEQRAWLADALRRAHGEHPWVQPCVDAARE